MKQNLPYEIINKILEMKSDLEEKPFYLQISESGKEYYKINRFFIHKKLQVLYEFKKNNPPRKIYISFYQKGNPSQLGVDFAYAYTFPIKNNVKYEYFIQPVWSYCYYTNYIFIKSVIKHPVIKMIYERGWASVFDPDTNKNMQYPIIGSPRYSEIFFFPDTYYNYMTFRIVDLDIIPKYHFCCQFFYTFRSNYFQEYDENREKFVHKMMPKPLSNYIYRNE